MKVTKRIEFCAAHRLLNHAGKCKHLHGHNYVAEVTFTGLVTAGGMVIDFADIKDGVKGWVDANWDHNCLLEASDPLVEALARADQLAGGSILKGRDPFLFPVGLPPTAEVMAATLFQKCSAWVANRSQDVSVAAVTIWETPTSSATSFR